MHLSAAAIDALEGMHKTHFLNSDAVRLDKSLGDEAGLRSIGVHLITVEPGHASTEHHVHLYEEECIYVLSGHGTAIEGEERYSIGPGDFIGCPAGGQPHTMVNDGEEPLVCLVFGERRAHDVVDYPRRRKRLYRHHGEWNVVDHTDIAYPKGRPR